ncbi:MAG: 2OG-Fe(II) oxygenase [Dokdonella sp.]|uniref:2OG-Fe(II) oxygenase family protein n=1 Tax=Dokdonella sp. TaxID=2291710 RepID=UPI0025BFF8D0|nr:2OG-Fe(II) oxygenase [Dokdonella sp.]MBZ0222131.1 2OG-Fe(II) oxygenase [Dokdonella sp.]MCC7254742.1 2OG-Fe(II) oxygenase [Dokdonella sp.]
MSIPAPIAATTPLLDELKLQREDTLLRHAPFSFLVAHEQLPRDAANELARDFPRYDSAGFFPWDPAECGPMLNRLIEELASPRIANAIGARLGLAELGKSPSLVTICRSLNKRHGTIHTDSKSKIVTALLYLNEQWPETDGGCLRFLRRIDDIDDMVVPQVRPLFGTLAAFRRADNSFHGHLPYEGERRVIQIAWLTSEEEKQRKTRRGRLSRLFKKLFGRLDRRLGAGRDRNAAHPD